MADTPPLKGGVQSIERAFALLGIVASAGGTIGLTDLAERAGCHNDDPPDWPAHSWEWTTSVSCPTAGTGWGPS
jgi:hypothetical protein